MKNNLNFNIEKITLLLNIEADDSISDKLKEKAVGKNLLPKKEFHITLIGRATGEILKTIPDSSSKIEEIYKKFNWNFETRDEFYFIEKQYSDEEKRSSIIQIIELPNLKEFYKDLNNSFETNFEVPFPHITLFTNSTKEENKLLGIGIYSEDQFKSLNPEKI